MTTKYTSVSVYSITKETKTMQIIWLTDIHLDHCHGSAKIFGEYLRQEHPLAMGAVITGDISAADRFKTDLASLSNGFGAPVWFVLGNHDGWGNYWAGAKDTARATQGWLTEGPLVKLDKGVVLTGVDGWYDAYYGDAERSCVSLVDWDRMPDFRVLSGRMALIAYCRSLAFAEAEQAAENLRKACKLKATKTVLFATHIPPWLEASHHGRVADPDWSPWFTSKLLGDAIFEVSQEHPKVQFNVLCGHSHFGGSCQIADNVTCYTGAADYGYPNICGIVQDMGKVLLASTGSTT